MPKKNKILICFDIDGTVANIVWRHKAAGPEPDRKNKKKFNKWLNKIQSRQMIARDLPVAGMREMVNQFKDNAIYVTARQSIYRRVTENWLKKHKFPKLPLFMRSPSDWSHAGEYKESVILDYIHKIGYTGPVIVVDDDDRRRTIEKMCKRQGWVMLKALSGK